jgi:carboxymethylenebutenolidase
MPIFIEEELKSLLPDPKIDRRHFIRASVGIGFAAAVAPIAAQTQIKTDTEGLIAGAVQIATGKDSIPGYRAKPAQVNKPAVVLVVSEIFGVHEHIADLCRRLAKAGYYAIAPELFVRQGDVAHQASIKEVIDVVARAPDAQVLGDLDACVAHAAADGGDVERLAITGFCWGGRIVWMYAAHSKSLKAGAAWYGRLTSGFNPALQPTNPIDVAARLQAPVLGFYGGQDDGIPQDSIERMRAALAQGGGPSRASRIIVYPDAPHAFNADYRPSYRPEAAHDAWRRMLAWFAEQGV